MKALTFHGKETVHFETVPDPVIKSPGDAIVEVKLAGICGSDLHPYHQREKGLDHGTVMGHEVVGHIAEVGKDVTSFKVGDKVLSPFTTNCGNCFFCRLGMTCRCEKGACYGWVHEGEGLQGGQAELIRVPMADTTLVNMPEGVNYEEGLLLGDILSTGYFCADMAEIKPEGVYVVVGCGPVGMLAIIAAIELGAKKVYAIDSIQERLAHARKFGAIPIDLWSDDALDVIREETEGRGADAVMEVVGNPSAGRLAVDLVRPCGIISAVGFHTEDVMAFSPLEAYDKNITFKAGRCPARYYIDKLIPLVQSNKYDLTSIISHRLPLSEGVRGYDIFDKKLDGCTKVVLQP